MFITNEAVFLEELQRVSLPKKETEIKVSVMVDQVESKSRLKYQLTELAIYIGWPVSIVLILGLFGVPAYFAGAIAGVAFVSPLVKGFIGKAKAGKDKDPRLMIRSSSFWYDGFMFVGSPALRQIRKYGALSRSLDMIYNYFERFNGLRPDGLERDWYKSLSRFKTINWMVKAWTTFWIGMPIAQDVRSRLALVAELIEEKLEKIYNQKIISGDNSPIKIAMLAGGTKQDLIMALHRFFTRHPDAKVEVVGVEPDSEFTRKRGEALMKYFGVSKKIFTDIAEKVSTDPQKNRSLAQILEKNGHSFKEFDMVICIGLGDYMFGHKLEKFVRMLDNGKTIITANISDNFVERFFLHRLIQWPSMQYLPISSYTKTLRKALGDNRQIKIIRTPHKIFHVAVVD